MRFSVPINNTIEYIKDIQISPFISKGVCKVCYVGQKPNRNKTVITKELAIEMGRNLPGSPIVGYFNEKKNDFEGHKRDLLVTDEDIKLIDMTKPYGFVPTNAKVWFQKFNDDGIEHNYLCTDAYIWSKTYPEAAQVIEKEKGQSMELSQDKGFWTNDNNTNERIFIYNEALIEKLCILGDDVEPCFEGAQFKSQFSLKDDIEFQDFKKTMFSMLDELQEILSKGGSQENMEVNENVNTEIEEFEKKTPEEEEKVPSPKTEVKEEAKEEEKNKEEEKKKYSLEDIPEYVELQSQFEKLQNNYSELQQKNSNLEEELSSLKEFKLATERQQKQAMIDSFYMLTEEDKKDVTENIDTYSLNDIEGKLSILCVRNKVNFNLDSENNNPQGLFNLNNNETDNAPDWIKAVRATVKGNN